MSLVRLTLLLDKVKKRPGLFVPREKALLLDILCPTIISSSHRRFKPSGLCNKANSGLLYDVQGMQKKAYWTLLWQALGDTFFVFGSEDGV